MTRGVSDDELFAAAVVIPGALDVFNSLVRDKLVKREDGRWKRPLAAELLGNEGFTGGFMNWLRKVAFEERPAEVVGIGEETNASEAPPMGVLHAQFRTRSHPCGFRARLRTV